MAENKDENEDENQESSSEEKGIIEKTFLEHTWDFTYKKKDKPQKGNTKKQQSEKDWLSSYSPVYSDIKSVEMFWSVKNNIKTWSKLHHGSIYSFFKKGINPSWEHPMNKEGCSYMFFFNKNRTIEKDLDDVFEYALIYLIGDDTTYVNGITFERKPRGDKMIVWCNAHSNELLLNVNDGVIPEHLLPCTTLESVELTDSRYKIIVRVVDHKSELERLH